MTEVEKLMESDRIQCPNCKTEIEVGEILARKIAAEVEARVRGEAEEKLKQAVQSAKEGERELISLQIKDMEAKLVEQGRAVKEAEEQELLLRSRQRELEKREKGLDQAIEKRVSEKGKEQEVQIREELARESSKELQVLKDMLQSREKAMDEAREREIGLMKEKRELEEQRKGMELDYQQRLDGERRKLEATLSEKYASETDLKMKERDQQIDGLRKALAEAQRKSEQGSMETQGEVLELVLAANLQQNFPHDAIDHVPKGIRGADVIQSVCGPGMAESGRIIWEAKNTKAWSNGWIEKLKDDQRVVGANLAVIVSSVLPEGIRNFGLIDGVWVCAVDAYIPLAMALRQQLLQVAFARSASEGKSEKMEMVYHYLSGDEFRQKIEVLVETFIGMQEQLEKEKRAFQRIWKEREKQIQRIIDNTAGMYGDIRGMIGSSVPEIHALSLDDEDILLESDD